MKRKHRRLLAISSGLAVLGAAAALVLSAVGDNLVFFVSPSLVAANPVAPGRAVRIGGLVEHDSLSRAEDGVTVAFRVTDMEAAIPVRYHGLLPDLFREGQGVVAEGSFDASGTFVATKVLAKHDEKYMPKEVADALKSSGHWEGED
ncbi:MAG: cytochrome c maturation protein CcmE [Pseudomonadota bacterium]